MSSTHTPPLPTKAPYEDLLTKLLIFVTIGLYLRLVGLTRTKLELQRLFAAIDASNQQTDFLTPLGSQAQAQPPDKKQKPKTPILKASDHASDGKHHLLLAATGSVATIKIPNILRSLSHHPNLSIRLILSSSAAEFLQGQADEQPSIAEISNIKNLDGIYFDEDEWSKPWVRGDSILHIELRRWADLMLVAPLSANSLAKIANGMSSDLVSSVVRAWDHSGLIDGGRPGVALPYDMRLSRDELATLPLAFRDGRKKGVVVAPAMNTAMWSHPVTRKHLSILQDEWGVERAGGWFEVLRPMEKMLACGDTGSGAMKDWKEIVGIVEERLGLKREAEVEAEVKKG